MTERTRPPEELAPEIWFYSLERRRQSIALRRVTIVLAVVAVVLMIASMAQPVVASFVSALFAAAIAIEAATLVRAGRQKRWVLAQLERGDNPQTVDAVGTSLSNRSVLLMAAASGAAVGAILFLIIGAVT